MVVELKMSRMRQWQGLRGHGRFSVHGVAGQRARSYASETEVAQSGVIQRTRARAIPEELAFALLDRHVVDAGMALLHQAVPVEQPILVATGAKPDAYGVVPLIGEPHGDPVVGKGPQLLNEPVLVFSFPLSREKRDDLLPATQKFTAVSPAAVHRVRQRHPRRIARIPGVFRLAYLLDRSLARERRQRRTIFGYGIHGKRSSGMVAGFSAARRRPSRRRSARFRQLRTP